jgi:hypothetical protein
MALAAAAAVIKLLREILLAASLHEIRPFSTAGAPAENCCGELKHPRFLLSPPAIRFSARRTAFSSQGGSGGFMWARAFRREIR